MVTGGSLWWRPVAFGAREVEDKALGLCGFFAVHGVNTMEKLIGQVGEHGGAGWGDAPHGSEDEETLKHEVGIAAQASLINAAATTG